MTLAELRRTVARGNHPEIEVHSVEGVIYVVHVDDDVLTEPRSDRAMRFPSAFAAARALGRVGIEAGWLVHASPYDEMIGRADEGNERPAPLRTRLRFPAPGEPA